MRKISHTRRLGALFFLCLACIPASLADAWHQFGDQDAYWHHGSGWIFPRHVGKFELVRTPYQIDGNDDVGAEYEMVVDGAHRTAEVAIYYPTSSAAGAKLATARAAMQSNSTLKSQGKLRIDRRPGIAGVRTTYVTHDKAGDLERNLYFFQTPEWIVTVRTTARIADAQASQALNAFVQEQRWETLATDSGRYH